MQRHNDQIASWLQRLHGDALCIADELPKRFSAYGRIFPPVSLALHDPKTGQDYDPLKDYRWSEIASMFGIKFSATTKWEELHATVAGNSRCSLNVSEGDELNSFAPDVPSRWLTCIGSVLRRYDNSESVFYGIWNGYGLTESRLGSPLHFEFPFRGYYVWSGTYDDFGRFRVREKGDRGGGYPQDIAWPHSRSWCYRVDTDWTSGIIGGTPEMIDDLVSIPDVEVLEIDGNLPSVYFQPNP